MYLSKLMCLSIDREAKYLGGSIIAVDVKRHFIRNIYRSKSIYF